METDRKRDRESQRQKDGSHEMHRTVQEKVRENVRERTKSKDIKIGARKDINAMSGRKKMRIRGLRINR